MHTALDYERVVFMVNPGTTGKLNPRKTIDQTKDELPHIGFVELETSINPEQTSETILKNVRGGDVIVPLGGDETFDNTFQPLLSRDATPAQREAPLVPVRGFGNACDFAAVANEKLSKISLADVLRYGNIVDVYPIAVHQTPEGSSSKNVDKEPWLLASYWDIGATALATVALDQQKQQLKAIKSDFRRWIKEGQTVFPAFLNAKVFHYKDAEGQEKEALDILVANIPRMAKTGHLPVRITSRDLYVVALKHANHVAKLGAIAGIATGTLPGRHMPYPETLSITTPENITGLYMQGGGKVVPAPPNTTITVGQHDEPIRIKSKKL